MNQTIDEKLEYYKNKINFILTDSIGDFIFPDGNRDKALLIIPDKRFGSNYPPPGTTLQDNKVGVVLRVSANQNLNVLFDEIDVKIKVSIFTNKDVKFLYDAWKMINDSTLPILGDPNIESGTIDPNVKHFLIFHLLTSI